MIESVEGVEKVGKIRAVDQEAARVEHATAMDRGVLFRTENDNGEISEPGIFAQPCQDIKVDTIRIVGIEDHDSGKWIVKTILVDADASKVKDGFLAVARYGETEVAIQFECATQRTDQRKIALHDGQDVVKDLHSLL